MLPLNTAATANGNLLQKSNPNGAEFYQYNGFNQLVILKQGEGGAAYGYNASGIRVSKQVGDTYTYYLLDGGDVVAECTDDALSAIYLRGFNLIYRTTADGTDYYLHDAHGDVVALTDDFGAVTKRYAYDAFGNEENPEDSDTNPFRYCGEYFDKETRTYYLRARYYDPAIGRFTQQDPHWSPANMIYGDNPRKIYERQDVLGLSTCTYAPEISAIMQSGNLYVYCTNSPVMYHDPSGQNSLALTWTGTMWWLTLVDGPIPVGDAAYLGIAVILLIGAIAVDEASSKNPIVVSPQITGGVSTPASPPPPKKNDDDKLSINQIKQMLSDVEPNRINHIMLEKHAWNLVGAKDWPSIASIIGITLANGEAVVGNAENIIYTYVYNGQVIEVTTRIVNNALRIVDALVRTR